MSQENIIRTELPGGVQVLCEPLAHVRSVAVGIWTRSGSRYETPDTAGVSHFLEHLFFKGTTTRTARQIAEEADDVGAQLNAFTAKEHCCYYARATDSQLDLVLELLCDLVLHPAFPAAEVQREREVVVEEIKMYDDVPEELVFDLAARSAWDGHPLGRRIVGSERVVRSITREQVVEFYERLYTSPRLVVAAAGHLEADHVCDVVASRLPPTAGARGPALGSPPTFRPRRVVRVKDTEQVHVVASAPTVAQDHPDMLAVEVLATWLGGGASSRLFQAVREERGWAYSVYCTPSFYTDCGLFSIYVATSPERADDVADLVAAELVLGARDGPSTVELARAKEQLKASTLLGLEGTGARMTRLGRPAVTEGRLWTMDGLLSAIEAVTAADVRRVAASLFVPKGLALASIGRWEGPRSGDLWTDDGAPDGEEAQP